MLRASPFVVPLLCLSACGGGGGGGTVAPVAVPVRLDAAPLDLGPAVTATELLVRLADDTTEAPALLQVAVELPPALALPASDRLVAATPVPNLDGEPRDGRFVVLCGDARNPDAAALPKGPLFRLRLVTATPRQPGTYELRLVDLEAAAADGRRLPVHTEATVVPVTIR